MRYCEDRRRRRPSPSCFEADYTKSSQTSLRGWSSAHCFKYNLSVSRDYSNRLGSKSNRRLRPTCAISTRLLFMSPTEHLLGLCRIVKSSPRVLRTPPPFPQLRPRIIQPHQLLRRHGIRIHTVLDCLIIEAFLNLLARLAKHQLIVEDKELFVALCETRFIGRQAEETG